MKTEELPVGWVLPKLGEIVRELNSGFACGEHNSSGKGIAHLRPMNVTSDGAIKLQDLRSVSAASYDKLRAGDVLFNNTNSTELVGKTAYIAQDTDWGYSNHMTRLRFDQEAIEPKYVARFLHHLFYAGYFRTNCNNHVSQASISAKFLANSVEIPLPPLAEQRRIVAKLDALMQRLDASRAKLDRVPAVLRRFRQAVLAAAVSGQLTEAWRAQQPTGGESGAELLTRIRAERRAQWEAKYPKKAYVEPADPEADELSELPEGWTWTNLEQITDPVRVICYGILMPKDHIPNGVPYVKVRDMRGDKIDVQSLNRTTPEIARAYARASLKKDDLLLSIRGTYGRVVEVPDELEGGNITQDTARIALLAGASSSFIASYLRSEDAQNYFQKVARGMAVKGVNISDVRPCTVPLPPLAEQQEIVRQVNHYFDLADGLEARLEQATALVDQLPQALLARAFKGELVPQDPTDEPAATLLARLRAEAAGAPATPGKRGRKAATT